MSAERDIDPVSAEIIGNAFLSIAEEMGEVLINTAYSTNIKERRDCSAVIFDASGNTIAQAEHIPVHLGSLIGFSEAIAARDGGEVADGDVFVCNDAYTGGGTHLHDVVIATPVFHDGRLVAWATNLAHHADLFDRGHEHIYQEGIRIPPVRLYRAGDLNHDVSELLLLNWQVPEERIKDLQAQVAANAVGARRIRELIGKYGLGVVEAAAAAQLDYAESRMRSAIAALPDGRYEASELLDSEQLAEPVPIVAAVEVRGDELHVDFTGTGQQVRGDLNMVHTALLATVFYVAKAFLDPTAPPNSGLFRPVHVAAPERSIVSCGAPAAVNGRMQTSQRVADVLLAAISKADPSRAVSPSNGANTSCAFGGLDPARGRFYGYLETIGGGGGATRHVDGMDGVQVHLTNTSNLPIEALEQEHPFLVEEYSLVDDSGGPGERRGGLGLRRRLRVLGHEANVLVRSTRYTQPATSGMGYPAGVFSVRIEPEDVVLNAGVGRLPAGSRIEVITPGGAGFGDPADRDRAAVAADLRDGKISPRTARDIYRYDITTEMPEQE